MQIKELGHVVLYVTNLERSADFYHDTLGFREIARRRGLATYSSGRTHHELFLIEVAGARSGTAEEGAEATDDGVPAEPKQGRPKPGLYHIGFKIGDGPEAAKAAFRELKEKNVTIVGTSDHGVTHSIYILDPDGNELELYADVSDEWKQNPQAVLQPIRPLDLV